MRVTTEPGASSHVPGSTRLHPKGRVERRRGISHRSSRVPRDAVKGETLYLSRQEGVDNRSGREGDASSLKVEELYEALPLNVFRRSPTYEGTASSWFSLLVRSPHVTPPEGYGHGWVDGSGPGGGLGAPLVDPRQVVSCQHYHSLFQGFEPPE